jgi:hypothetical protein
MPGSEKQNSMFKPSTGYVQKNNPFPVTSCGRRRNMGSPLHSNEPRKTTKGKGRNFRTVKEGAGMTEKGVENYKDKNPGSNLQTAVTEKNPSKKDKKRRDAFCARSRSWTGERGKAARRRWRC